MLNVILNYDSDNNIHPEILKNIFKNKIKIIGKIKYDKNYNLLITHQFNLLYVNKLFKNNLYQIIKKIIN